jgi:hypothetical protein
MQAFQVVVRGQAIGLLVSAIDRILQISKRFVGAIRCGGHTREGIPQLKGISLSGGIRALRYRVSEQEGSFTVTTGMS